MDDYEIQRMTELRMGYPERIYLVGGPYCGYFLMPHTEVIGNVLTEMTGVWDARKYTPHSFNPIDEREIVFVGALGAALYRLGDDLRWSFVRLFEPEPVG